MDGFYTNFFKGFNSELAEHADDLAEQLDAAKAEKDKIAERFIIQLLKIYKEDKDCISLIAKEVGCSEDTVLLVKQQQG